MNKKLLALLLMILLCSCSSERKDWEKATTENNIHSYEEFLNSNPDSPLADEARSNIIKLYFEKAQSINTPKAYENFLERYPKGQLADKARSKIQELFLEEAVSINTIPAYEEFLNKYPKGLFTEEARLRMEKLIKARHPDFRKTKTVKIIVKQSYGVAVDVSFPFEEMAKEFCEYAGLKVVGTAAKDYDVAFRIQARGQAEGASYWDIRYKSKNYQFSGARISVTISLKVPGIPAYTKSCKGFVSPAKKLKDFVYSNPSSAPFHQALINSGFYPQILKVMQRLYGLNTLVLAMKNYRMAEDLIVRKGKAAVELLITALKHRDEIIRNQAASALGKIEDSRAIEPLSNTLKEDKVVFVRETAVKALEKIKDVSTIVPLVFALKDEDPGVRNKALNALDKLNWKPKNNDERVMFYICKGKTGNLVEIGKAAVEPLIAILTHPDETVRDRAVSALGEIKDSRAIQPLLTVMKSKDRNFQWLVAEALTKITGKFFSDDLRKWQNWWKKNKKKYLKKE